MTAPQQKQQQQQQQQQRQQQQQQHQQEEEGRETEKTKGQADKSIDKVPRNHTMVGFLKSLSNLQ